MKHFPFLFCLVFLLSLSVTGRAQAPAGKGSITGTVLDAVTGKPVDYASISVFTDSSRQPVNGGITDAQGVFTIGGLAPGAYRLGIDFINFRRDTINRVVVGAAPVHLGTIRLQPSGNSLAGVTITANAPLVEQRIDKIVYNAAADITAQGGVALDVLKKVPQVTVDVDGNVELQGNANIRFLINGKPSSVFGNSLADALAAIPASQIRSIEAITSPGARYDAQGTGGIINIILKDPKVQGYNGSVSLSAGTRLQNGSLNLNVRKGGFGVNAFFTGNAQLSSATPFTQDRQSSDAVSHTSAQLLQHGSNDFERHGYQAGLGFDARLSAKDNLSGGLSYNYFGNRSRGLISQQALTREEAGTLLSDVSGLRTSDNRSHTASIDWNLDYSRQLRKEGQELEVQYEASFGSPQSDYSQAQTMAGELLPYAGAVSTNPGTDRQTYISVDYTDPMKNGLTLETGVKANFQDISSQASVMTLQKAGNEYIPDPSQSYRLGYRMNVYGAYCSGSWKLLRFLDVKAGARYEYTDVRLDFPNTTVPSYGLLVPSVIVAHTFAGKQTLKLAYSRRVERAEYDELNPFVNRSDPNNLTTGNPLLQPEIGDNLELGYGKSFGGGGSLNISLIERINSQDHKRIVTFYTAYPVGDSLYRNVSVQTVQNTGTEYNSGVNLSGSWPVTHALSLRGNAMMMHRYIVSGAESGNMSMGFRLRLNANATWQLPGDLAAEAFANYSSAARNIQGKNPQWLTYTIAFRKQFWDRKASLGLTATNPFSRYVRQVTTIETDHYTSVLERQLPFRSFGLSFNWKFGRLEFRKGREEDNSYLNEAPGTGN